MSIPLYTTGPVNAPSAAQAGLRWRSKCFSSLCAGPLVRPVLRQKPGSIRSSGCQQQPDTSNSSWVPPDMWLSGVAASLPSVDVDSLPAYTHLLQEVLVLAPALLQQPARQAAASLTVLERFTRSSAVWFGPALVAELLQSHTPDSLQVNLGQLMQVWLELGQVPHSFGMLFLEAPAALASFTANPTAFRSHLAQLQALLGNGPIAEQLLASSSLAGYLLSCQQPAEALAGALHRRAGWLIIAPETSDLLLLEEEEEAELRGDVPGSESSTASAVLSVYGSRPATAGSGSSANSSSSDGQAGACNGIAVNGSNGLGAQVPSAGGVYGWQAAVQAAVQAAQVSSIGAAPAPADFGPRGSITAQSWQHPLTGNSSSSNITSTSNRQLLMRLDVLLTDHSSKRRLVPVLLLPPPSEQQV